MAKLFAIENQHKSFFSTVDLTVISNRMATPRKIGCQEHARRDHVISLNFTKKSVVLLS